MPNVKIKLAKPILDHDGPVHFVELREPTFDEYLAIGDPYEVAKSPEGALFSVQNADVIRSYVEACLVKPSTPDLLSGAGLPTARKVRDAVLGFFRDGGEAADEASQTSPTSSSSEASGSTPAA